MTLREFKIRVQTAFGPQMEHATPANIREFLDTLAHERWQEEKAARTAADPAGESRVEIGPAEPTSYEEILRRFFADILQAPNEAALIQLWLFALDLAYAGLEEQMESQIGGLFEASPTEEESDDHD